MEENAEQEKADEETDFELSEMEEDDIDLLEPSQNADTDAFVENDNGTDDLDEDEIIAEEMSNEADDTASNQMESHKIYIYIFQIVSSYKHLSYSHYFVATGVVCVRRAFLQLNSAGQQSSQTSSSSAQHISVYSFVSQERQTSSSSFPR